MFVHWQHLPSAGRPGGSEPNHHPAAPPKLDWRSVQTWVEPWVAVHELVLTVPKFAPTVRVTVVDAPDGSLYHWVLQLSHATLQNKKVPPACVLNDTAPTCSVTVSPWARTCLELASEGEAASMSLQLVRKGHTSLVLAPAGLSAMSWGPAVARSKPFLQAVRYVLFFALVSGAVLAVKSEWDSGNLIPDPQAEVALLVILFAIPVFAWETMQQFLSAPTPLGLLAFSVAVVAVLTELAVLTVLVVAGLLGNAPRDRLVADMWRALQRVLAGAASVAAGLMLFHSASSILAGLLSLVLLPLAARLAPAHWDTAVSRFAMRVLQASAERCNLKLSGTTGREQARLDVNGYAVGTGEQHRRKQQTTSAVLHASK